MKSLVQIARLIVSVTFIFSGFVKLVDPLGSAYKFQEYFSAEVLNLEFLIPYALPFAILLILIEIMLGVLLALGYLPKFTTLTLLVMILIFLFLTWYSAYYNKVTDCGCFGEAVKLSPWGTFYKNIVLLVLIVLLVISQKLIRPLFKATILKWLSFASFMLFLYIIYHVLIHLPLIDFRPYAVGKNIQEGMRSVNQQLPPIHDFILEDANGNNLTDSILNSDKVMLIVMYNINKSDNEGFGNIKNITDKALENGYKIYALSASFNKEFEAIKNKYQFNFDVLFGDEITLKTIIRANPGIVTLHKGTVTGKWNWMDANDVRF